MRKPKKIRIKKVKFKKPKASIKGLLNKARIYVGNARSPKSFLSVAFKDVFVGLSKTSSDYLPLLAIYKNMFNRYGHEWIDLAPGSFKEETFGDNIDKVMALKTLLKTDEYFRDTFAFEKITMAFNDVPVDPGSYQEILPDQIAYSLVQAHIFRDDVAMSNNVEQYILAHLIDCGFPVLLWPFEIEIENVPEEIKNITNRVEEWLMSEIEEVDEDLLGYVEKYYDMIDILMDKLNEDDRKIEQIGY